VKIETMPVLEQKTGPLYPEILAIMRRYNLNVFTCRSSCVHRCENVLLGRTISLPGISFLHKGILKTGPLYPEILAIMRRYNLNVASAFQCGKMTMAVVWRWVHAQVSRVGERGLRLTD
jgi:hypothetical protein